MAKKTDKIQTLIIVTVEAKANNPDDYFEKVKELDFLIPYEIDVRGNAFEEDVEGMEFVAYYRKKRKKIKKSLTKGVK